MNDVIFVNSHFFFVTLTPTPRPLIDTTVKAAKSVIITPTTNAVGIIAKLRRLNK